MTFFHKENRTFIQVWKKSSELKTWKKLKSFVCAIKTYVRLGKSFERIVSKGEIKLATKICAFWKEKWIPRRFLPTSKVLFLFC